MPPVLPDRTKINLHGPWERFIAGLKHGDVTVPSSYRALGTVRLTKTVTMRYRPHRRYFIRFEGILSRARVRVNGNAVGRMGPWVPYEFEFTPVDGENTVDVEIYDVNVPFGPVKGRSFYGGIIREAYIEERPPVFMENVRVKIGFIKNYTECNGTVTATINGRGTGRIAGEVVYDGTPVARFAGTPRNARFTVTDPHLWSPAAPHLYDIRVRFTAGNRIMDRMVIRTGFREIKAVGRELRLNGEKIFLKGVCKHEFDETHGYTVPRNTVRRELLRMKAMGCNFVRLVHMPHGRDTVELADELGLMVSEEPAVCWDDLTDPVVTKEATEIQRRLIQRDGNAPSVIAWIVANECAPDMRYYKKLIGLCHRLDPSRPASFANVSAPASFDKIRRISRECRADMVCINLYATDPRTYADHVKPFRSWPFVFSEWGGNICQGNPRMMRKIGALYAKGAWARDTDALKISGSAFWVWKDYEERSRNDAVTDGRTIEGLVDHDDRPKEDVAVMQEVFAAIDTGPSVPEPVITITAPRDKGRSKKHCHPVDLGPYPRHREAVRMRRTTVQQRSGYGMVQQAGKGGETLNHAVGNITVDRIPFTCCASPEGLPLFLDDTRPRMSFSVNRTGRVIHFLGHVTLGDGYPVTGTPGQPVARYRIEYDGGRTETVDLCNGIHYARMNRVYRSWLLDPTAVLAKPVLEITVETGYEINRVNLFSHPVPEPAVMIKSITWELVDSGARPGLYGITVQSA